MKAGIVVFLALIPFGASGGVYTCVRGETVTYSDQACRESAPPDAGSAVRPTPRSDPLSLRPAGKKLSKSEKRAQRKALEQRLRDADEELMWLYRERRAAVEEHMVRLRAETGGAALSADESAEERKAFEAGYEHSIKILRREIVDLSRQLADPDAPFTKSSYASR